MISSVFNLKENKNIPSNLKTIADTKLEENYYFNNSLDFLLECHKELLSYKQDFYKTVLECSEDTPYIITESFHDLISSIKQSIKKILAYIETLVSRFITQIAKFIKSDSYILSKESELKKFSNEDKFKIHGYEYTFKDNVPVVDIEGLDVYTLIKSVESIKDSSDEDKASKLSDMTAYLSNETNMDDIRSQILNTNHKVPENTFDNEVFCIFRDGNSEDIEIEIDKSEVLKALDLYKNYKDIIKNIKSSQSKITNKYKELERQVDSLGTPLKNSNTSQAINQILNKLIITQINLIQKISTLHVQAFSAKLDAYNAMTLQNRRVLYSALNAIQKNPKNNKIFKQESVDYTKDINYNNYLLEKYYLNMNQKHFLEECVALSESNIVSLKYINEDIKMDQKTRFQKFQDALTRMINKFMEKINSFINKDKEFLQKNKETILTKKVQPVYTLNNMPPYSEGIKVINEWMPPKTIPAEKLVSMTELDIKKMIIPAYEENKGEFADFAKRYFLCNNGKNEDRKSDDPKEMNMQNIYDYCLNIPQEITKINVLKNSFNNTIKGIVAMINTHKNESVDEFGRTYLYSTVLETYINEADPGDTNSNTGSTNANTGTNTNTNANNTTNNNNSQAKQNNIKTDVPGEDKKDNTTEKDPENKEKQGDDTNNSTKSQDSKAMESAGWYSKNMQIAIGAKLTAMQKIYSEYMKIMRYHVKAVSGGGGLNEEDEKALRDLMKEYRDSEDKKPATEKIISFYKSKLGKTIDAHDVENIVNQNKDNL